MLCVSLRVQKQYIVILISAKHLFRRIINKKRDSGLVFKFVKEELTAQSADSNIPSGY